MASQPPTHKSNEPCQQQPQPRMLDWARRAGRACLKQLGQPGTAGPLLFTCLCLALAYKNSSKMWRPGAAPPARAVEEEKRRRAAALQRSVSMAALHGGRQALERIMDAQEKRIDESGLVSAAELQHFRTLLQDKTPSFSSLQRTAAKLEMSGKEDEAVEMLKVALKKAEDEGRSHEAYELEMLLVEMLIYKGNYSEAFECKCLNDTEISDARRPLYKAVIDCIHGHVDQAKAWYNEFQDIRSRFHWPDDIKEGSPLQGAIHDFQIFDRIVNNLKREIDMAHLAKKTDKDK